jgi:glycine/D-amino acid oxidase-like deaminating enzyme
VKSWRVDTLLPLARETYRELESVLGVTLWRDLRVRRFFVDERERRIFAGKQARGELAPFAGAADEAGFWIEGAARVDLPALLDAARERWRKQGRFISSDISSRVETTRHELVIDCTGVVGARDENFSFVPWEFSKGETLTLAVDGLAPDIVLNRGHWVLPFAPGVACVGATHDPCDTTSTPTAAARATLEASARVLLARPFAVTGHEVGVRVNLPDKHPVAGRHPANARLGLINGLGAKGALVAPWLARQWVDHLATGAGFEAEVAVGRFFGNHSSQAWSL